MRAWIFDNIGVQ